MALETNLNASPYYDDFDETKNFYRVLHRPAVAVQARELTQAQSILQDQISKFGRHIFKEGSVVEGCSFSFNNRYYYVKLTDNQTDGTNLDVLSFVGKDYSLINGVDLKASIVNAVDGLESLAPDLKTLYIVYSNAKTYANGYMVSVFTPGETLSVVDSANAVIATVQIDSSSNAVGTGYSFTTSEGVIFKKGFFVRVDPETVIVSKYDNLPNNLSVGFEVAEEIITPEVDPSLLDNAAGAKNYAAPGAHRLKLSTGLLVKNTSSTISENEFFSLVDFKNGNPVSIKNDPQYSTLGKEMARRTYEESGHYTVRPFLLSTTEANTTHFDVNISPGIAYVDGYRTEIVNKTFVPVRKGLDTVVTPNQPMSTNFGYYLRINEYAGEFDVNSITRIEIHNDTYSALSTKSFIDVAYNPAQIIGRAHVRGLSYSEGIPGTPSAIYNLYIFNMIMNRGKNFSDARSVVYYNGSDVVGVADLILENGYPIIKESALNSLLFPLGQDAISLNGFDDMSYVYRNKINASVLTDGTCTFSAPSVIGTGDERFSSSGTLSSNLERDYIVIAATDGLTPALSGSATYTDNANTIVGTGGSLFATQYSVGDYINIDGQIGQITRIANNTFMEVDVNFTGTATSTHRKTFPAGSIIPINTRDDRTITVSGGGSTATIDLNETLSSSMSVKIYQSIIRSNTYPIAKVINKNKYVRIDCSTHPNGANGPWDLGFVDVYNINAIYIGDTADTTPYDPTGADNKGKFIFSDGQRATCYIHGVLEKDPRSPPALTATSTILIDLDYFTYDQSQGVGFFNFLSYPIDDTNTANTNAITTATMPTYTGESLRNFIDFRPFLVNTGVVTSVVDDSTINPATTTTFSVTASGSYLPTPDSVYQSQTEHYLPRIDRIVLNAKGQFNVVEGTSDDQPSPPRERPGEMSLGLVYIPPYPSLVYTQVRNVPRPFRGSSFVTIQPTKNQRYTMKDIRTIDSRVEALEYYTSLSLLEKKTKDMLVRDDQGNDRFKNGFLVDPFDDHFIGNTKSFEYNCTVDMMSGELRPKIRQFNSGFNIMANSGTEQMGSLVTLAWSEVNYLTQQYASKKRNCIEGNVYTYNGIITLEPFVDTSVDNTTEPVVITPDTQKYTAVIDKGPGAITTVFNNWVGSAATSMPSWVNDDSTSKKSDKDDKQRRRNQ